MINPSGNRYANTRTNLNFMRMDKNDNAELTPVDVLNAKNRIQALRGTIKGKAARSLRIHLDTVRNEWPAQMDTDIPSNTPD